MTVHRWFEAKACPGEWLYERHGQIAEEVNSRLNGKDDENMTLEQFGDPMNQFRAQLQHNDSSGYSEEARNWAVENGLVNGNDADKFNGMWEDFLTREQFITVLYRFAKLMGKA